MGVPRSIRSPAPGKINLFSRLIASGSKDAKIRKIVRQNNPERRNYNVTDLYGGAGLDRRLGHVEVFAVSSVTSRLETVRLATSTPET